MSKYDTTWGALRRKHGLRWQDKYPKLQDIPNGKTALIIGLLGLLLIALIVAVQYQNEATEAAKLAELRANQLGDCTLGNLRFVETADDGSKKGIVCKKAEEFSI